MTYTIEQVKSKTVTTKFGEKLSYSFKANGDWFNHGFKKPVFAEGDVVTFDYAEGKYGKDVDPTTVRKASGAAPAASVPKSTGASFSAPKSVFPISPMDGQRSIIRQNCVTNARELFIASHGGKAFDLTKEDAITTIINLARKFEAYAAGDLDLAKAMEMSAKAATPAEVAAAVTEAF